MTPSRPKPPRAPGHLSAASKRWWATVVTEYQLEAHHLRILQAAGEAWDRLQGARKVLDDEGVSYVDRFGAPRSRPEVAVERDSRIAFTRCVRELGLDDSPQPEGNRPPTIRGRG